MKVNRTKEVLRRGGTAVGTMIGTFASPEVAAIVAAAGFDFFIVDNEHGFFSLESDQALIRQGRECGIDAFVRVPDAAYHLIARTLDAGAEGVMIPRVEDRETVEQIVQWVYYPPLGRRGYGAKPMVTGYRSPPMPQVMEHLNRNTLLIIQVESAAAVDRVQDLVAVPGVDVALIGPADLSTSLGVPGEFEHPKMERAMQRVVDACNNAGIACGAHLASTPMLNKWRQRGMRFLMCSSDARMLLAGASEIVAALKT